MTATITFEEAVQRIFSASNPAELFGEEPEARDHYKNLARLVHPDTVGEDRRKEATSAFARLSALWDLHLGKIVSGPVVITTRKRSYVLSDDCIRGNVANLYRAHFLDDDQPKQTIVKIPRSPRDNDLMEAEAAALKRVQSIEEGLQHYVSGIRESFRHRDSSTKTERRINILNPLDGFYSLEEVKQAYPDGLDPRDAAWMWRRLLVALEAVRKSETVHGAVLPSHIMIHPELHGVVLVDWCYSTSPGGKVPAVVSEYRYLYPQEVLKKEEVSVATDIYMASRTMGWLLGPRAPTQFKAFIKGCSLKDESMRPKNPLVLLGEFDELIERLFGPRKFRVFEMPKTTTSKENK